MPRERVRALSDLGPWRLLPWTRGADLLLFNREEGLLLAAVESSEPAASLRRAAALAARVVERPGGRPRL